MTRVLTYVRHSTDKQSPTSCADQARNCHGFVALRPDWRVVLECADPERSGFGDGALRPGYRQMLAAVKAGQVDVVLVDELSRLSRDIAEPFVLYRELQFRQVKLVTVADGEINVLTLTMRSAMNSQYLDTLKRETRRGLTGVVLSGRSGGGCPYGYVVDRTTLTKNRRGEVVPEPGHLTIDPAQAAIVRRIFHEFGLLGQSPLAICRRLNAEGVPPPSVNYRRNPPRYTPWDPSTLRGDFTKQSGLLRNTLYIGVRTWNKLEYRKHPTEDRRVGFVREASKVVTTSAPHLRILDDVVWHAAQARLAAMRTAARVGRSPERARRPQHLLSGLAKCETCGASFVTTTRTMLRCHNHAVTQTCQNHRALRREDLESRVLTALKGPLVADGGPFDAFCRTVAAEREQLATTHETGREDATRALADVSAEIQHLVAAIKRGVDAPEMVSEMQALQARKAALVAQLADTQPPVALPTLDAAALRTAFIAAVAHIEDLLAAADETLKAEARELLRGVIERVEITPGDGPLWVVGKVDAVLRTAAGGPDGSAGTPPPQPLSQHGR